MGKAKKQVQTIVVNVSVAPQEKKEKITPQKSLIAIVIGIAIKLLLEYLFK